MNEEKEIVYKDNELIVSMTDAKGNITYGNDIFYKIAGYEKEELIGKPHNTLRHPDMPKAVFKLVWEHLLEGQTIYGILKNRAKNGDYYWVKAFFKPITKNGKLDRVIAYRQTINDYAKQVVTRLYEELRSIERSRGMNASSQKLSEYLEERNLSYISFIDRLSEKKQITNKEALNINYESYYHDHVILRQHVIHQCEIGNTDVEVTDSCCCRFGKWLESVKHETYTRHGAWREMLHAHDHVHNKLKDYVSAAKNRDTHRQEKILDEVKEDTTRIFNNLQNVIDESE